MLHGTVNKYTPFDQTHESEDREKENRKKRTSEKKQLNIVCMLSTVNSTNRRSFIRSPHSLCSRSQICENALSNPIRPKYTRTHHYTRTAQQIASNSSSNSEANFANANRNAKKKRKNYTHRHKAELMIDTRIYTFRKRLFGRSNKIEEKPKPKSN